MYKKNENVEKNMNKSVEPLNVGIWHCENITDVMLGKLCLLIIYKQCELQLKNLSLNSCHVDGTLNSIS